MSSHGNPAGGRLSGKTALVTGGSRGIGRSIAERLAEDGAQVVVHYGGDETAAKETVAAITAAGGSATALRQRLGVPGDAAALWAEFDRVTSGAGVDILVNNAGVVSRLPFGEITEEEYDRVFAVNTKAPFFLVREGLTRLRDGGRVINLSTGLARGAMMPDLIAYSMTKSALDVMTRDLAKVLGARGITVNSVAPGITDTDMNAGWLRSDDEALAAAATQSALGRVGQPRDIADVVAFLASDDSRWVTGTWLDATGGAMP
ncbi:SDR family oxidoreductase [Streptomyces katsurahamanus]|uniref:SDR family oxidoreductase n=1 Tax=Streptomyces katsurahamanus TaxID=2577098 RepID=A0ABW9NQA9_9ACTN|nr:SDR family oxidoreductase [Streptomyces katsurahamanus]MQS35502.1 SDR family oxidoreductase [Streptomyces katsurahamanus]